MTVVPARSVQDIEDLFLRYQAEEVPLAGDVPAVLISHGVQCAEELSAEFPDDPELQVAGLLHDIGLLLVPGDELGHPRHGAQYVRGLFGDRTAAIIGLHVDAQRYLEATVPGYRVTPPPTAAFAEQPEPMTEEEIHQFRAHPLFRDAIALRHADDRAGDDARRESGLGVWRSRMADLAARIRS
jgi:predicted HD phosphohydrolase